MRNWSTKSLQVRATLDPRLQTLVDELLEYMDVSLTCGFRSEEEQEEAVRTGHSQIHWPNGRHNQNPSVAVDMQPYPYPLNDADLHAALGYMAGLCRLIAERNGFEVRWGGDWNRDGSVVDNKFDDLFHVEIYNAD